jgi:hypothetical protein
MCTAKQDLDAAVSMLNIHFAKLNSAMESGNFANAATALHAIQVEAKYASGLVAKVTVAKASENQRR